MGTSENVLSQYMFHVHGITVDREKFVSMLLYNNYSDRDDKFTLTLPEAKTLISKLKEAIADLED